MSGITDPAQYYFKDGLWTYDGSVWRPQDQLVAYRDVVRESYFTATAAAGANTKSFTAVPTGEVWVIQTCEAINLTTAASAIRFYIFTGGANQGIYHTDYLVPTRYGFIQPNLVIKAGEYVKIEWINCALNDSLYAAYNGYKFKVAE